MLILLVSKYKQFTIYWIILIVNSQYNKIEREKPNIKYNYFLFYINNTLNKLRKHQRLLLQLQIYIIFITINFTIYTY